MDVNNLSLCFTFLVVKILLGFDSGCIFEGNWWELFTAFTLKELLMNFVTLRLTYVRLERRLFLVFDMR